jgi:segregation and condensation protein B
MTNEMHDQQDPQTQQDEQGQHEVREQPVLESHIDSEPATAGLLPRNAPYFFTLERYDQRRALESLIFASDDPITTRSMHRILVLEDNSSQSPGQQALPLEGETVETVKPEYAVPKGYFDELIDEINDDLERTDRPFRVVKIAGGYQFATTPQHGHLVQRLLKARSRKRLTQAAIETLAIIAYRQPVSKAEIEAVRGVNSSEVVNSLVERLLVTMVGRAETIGKPLLYGTTDEFLRVFGLHSLSDLPKLREIDELLKTTTTLIEADDAVELTTDHKLLRKQLAALLDGDKGASVNAPAADSEAHSGAYWTSEDVPGDDVDGKIISDPEATSEAIPDPSTDELTQDIASDDDEPTDFDANDIEE